MQQKDYATPYPHSNIPVFEAHGKYLDFFYICKKIATENFFEICFSEVFSLLHSL